ncbi:hypothetical protein IMSHALPRED_003846 [Imshaugia aleurites]|uniref:Uncharacterized protein n=1 Tax=Imshaugia aleurites TaxID=172621 RepID=A0A8H3PJP2_9LECA|nr:hypothetical protein IMSHALPRED_003846 [Imshaugia aleurites]
MTSNSGASLATPPPEPLTVYILSYNCIDWIPGVFLLDGSKPGEGYFAILNNYRSLSDAQDAGSEWGLKQLQDCLDTYDPPLATDKDRDAAFDEWAISESVQGGVWSYTISKDNERLIVRAEKFEWDGSLGPTSDDRGRPESS